MSGSLKLRRRKSSYVWFHDQLLNSRVQIRCRFRRLLYSRLWRCRISNLRPRRGMSERLMLKRTKPGNVRVDDRPVNRRVEVLICTVRDLIPESKRDSYLGDAQVVLEVPVAVKTVVVVFDLMIIKFLFGPPGLVTDIAFPCIIRIKVIIVKHVILA